MIVNEFHRGDIIILDNNGRRLYAVIVSNNNPNYNDDVVSVVNITTRPEGNPITHVDIMTNQPATVICERIWNVWKGNVMEFVRECTTEEMNAIDKALRIAFGLVETQARGMAQDMERMCVTLDKAQAEEAAALIEELRTENERIGKEYDNLEKQLEELQKENETLLRQCEERNECNDALIAGNETLGNRCADLEAQLEETALQRDKIKCAYDKLSSEFEGLKNEAVAQSDNLVQLTAENAKLRDKLKDHAEMRPAVRDVSEVVVERDLYKILYEQLIDKLIGA